MADKLDLLEFQTTMTNVRAALAGQTPSEFDSIRSALGRFESHKEESARAEALLTQALVRFPLQPYILTWRANARMRLAMSRVEPSATEVLLPDAMDAVADLELASEVAPDYLEPRIDLAFHVLNYLDNNARATSLFNDVIAKLSERLCESVAGLVEALRYDGRDTESHDVLARWLRAFPDSQRLLALLRTGG